jgi:hypothetical protein
MKYNIQQRELARVERELLLNQSETFIQYQGLLPEMDKRTNANLGRSLGPAL